MSTPAHRPVVLFNGTPCHLNRDAYHSGKRTALWLTSADDGQQVAMCTVNLPEEYLDINEVFIKDYSENFGMVNALRAIGLIDKANRRIKQGWVEIDSYTLHLPTLAKYISTTDTNPNEPATH